jgi:Domain of unknown function (DUF6984)
MSPEPEPESAPRPLVAAERAVLLKLLSADFPGRDALREQAAEALGRRIDAEGSLALQPSQDAPAADVVRRIPVEAETEDRDAMPIHVLLHVVNGYMNELEVYREDSGKLDRPIDPEALRVIVL